MGDRADQMDDAPGLQAYEIVGITRDDRYAGGRSNGVVQLA